MKRAKMDLEKKLTDEELAHTKLSADVGALKAAVISLIEALPESRKAAVEANMKLFMKRADRKNEELAPFSVGEETTHRMHDSLRKLIEFVTSLRNHKEARK